MELHPTKLNVVDFHATWCGPCRMLAPILDAAKQKHDFNLIKIDIDQNKDAAVEYSVSALPTLVFIKEGKVVDRVVGFSSQSKLDSLIQRHKI